MLSWAMRNFKRVVILWQGLFRVLVSSFVLVVTGAVGGLYGVFSFGLVLGGMVFSFMVDFYSVGFFFVRAYVVTSILLFSGWYMGEEVYVYKFMSYLAIFLFFMFLLTMGGNLFSLLIRWEGVGIFSFLLISW